MAKKKHIVLARDTDIAESGVEIDGQKMKFHAKQSAFWVEDEGKAKAIQQKYGKKVAVTLDQQYTWHVNNEGGNGMREDNIHNYTFQGVDTSHLKPKDYGYVWVEMGGRHVRIKKEEAQRNGHKIVPQKRNKRAARQEV